MNVYWNTRIIINFVETISLTLAHFIPFLISLYVCVRVCRHVCVCICDCVCRCACVYVCALVNIIRANQAWRFGFYVLNSRSYFVSLPLRMTRTNEIQLTHARAGTNIKPKFNRPCLLVSFKRKKEKVPRFQTSITLTNNQTHWKGISTFYIIVL